MHPQGVGRSYGVATNAVTLGVVRTKTNGDNDGDDAVFLGLGQHTCAFN